MTVDRVELLERYGRVYGELGLAIAFTRSTEGDDAKRCGTGWDKTAPLRDGGFGAGLLSNRGKARNPAVVLGPSGLIGLECDTPEGLDEIVALELPPTVTVQSSTSTRLHFWFRPANGSVDYVAFRFEGAGVSADRGRYLLVPPAIHPTGAVYSFLRSPEETEIAVLPDEKYDELVRRARGNEERTNGRAAPIADEIPEGGRHAALLSLAGSMRKRGMVEAEILGALRITNTGRCKPPMLDEELEELVRDVVARYAPDVAEGSRGFQPSHNGTDQADPAGGPDHASPEALDVTVVTLDEFVSVDEPGAEALLGDAGEALIPENGDVMIYGDGGAGKTTLAIDCGFHLAAGDEWLGIPVARPLRVLFIENEGPRPLFRAKLRRKRDSWAGSTTDDRIDVIEAPWARLSLADERCREALARVIRERELDVVVCGPVTRSGMNEAGTLQEVRDFMVLVSVTRRLAGRHVTFVLIHHENKNGKVSGAWEGAGDTLFHVQAQGHGRTRLYVQKARWSSEHHETTLNLVWADGEAFDVEDKPEVNDETLAEQLLGYIGENPGTGWGDVEKATPGTARDRRRNVRDGLFAAGRIVNVVKEGGQEVALDHCPERRPARLFLADDPSISHLRRGPGAGAAQPAPPGGENAQQPSAPCAPPYKGRRRSGADSPPAESSLRDGQLGDDEPWPKGFY